MRALQRRIVEPLKAMLVLPMSRALANLLLGSMRKMNLVLVALNLGSRGFGKLGDGRRRHDLSLSFRLILPPGFRRRCFLVVYQGRTLIIIITETILPSPYYTPNLITCEFYKLI